MQHDDIIPSDSPINQHSLETQNKRLYDHLASGYTINFLQAKQLGVSYLNSRISNLKESGIPIYSRFIRIGNTQCKEYSLQPFADFQGK